MIAQGMMSPQEQDTLLFQMVCRELEIFYTFFTCSQHVGFLLRSGRFGGFSNREVRQLASSLDKYSFDFEL